jgi:flagellar biosynthesis component FlhA
VKTVSQKDPGLVAHVIDSGALSVPKFAEVLQTMVREGLYIGNIRSILEDVASLFAKVDQPKDSFVVIEEIVAGIKAKRIKEVLNKVTSVRGGVRVISIGKKLSQDLEQAVGRDDQELILNDRAKMAQMHTAMSDLLTGIRNKGLFPVAVCCEVELRSLVSSILKEKFHNVPVISWAEAALVGFTEELAVWEL